MLGVASLVYSPRRPARFFPKISNQQTPIADLEYPYPFSAIDTLV
jgi:hypothetical protein